MAENGGPKLRKALCVRPDDDTFELLRLQLIALGYEVEHALGASAAIGLADEKAFDIYILNNWWLSEGQALTLCRELHRKHPATPILFYSNNAYPAAIAEALEAGARAYIALPDTSGDLPRVLEQLDRGEFQRRAAAESGPD